MPIDSRIFTHILLGCRVTILLLSCLFPQSLFAQQRPTNPSVSPKIAPAYTDLKIIDEHTDSKGNIIRTIQYKQGGNSITETRILRPGAGTLPPLPINPDTLQKDSVLLIVNKSKNNLQVFYRRKLIRTYKAVFGPKPMEDKCMAGDRCTPEGWFTIKLMKPYSKYHKFLLLSYPDDSAQARFNRLKESGKIPKTALIGGDVGIHGIWNKGDDMIEMGVNWTDGCVAIKNKDIDELYTFVVPGTRIYIRK